MRLPLLLALAVIVLTPANIREIALDMTHQAQATVASVLKGKAEPTTLEVAEAAPLQVRHDTVKNSISNVR